MRSWMRRLRRRPPSPLGRPSIRIEYIEVPAFCAQRRTEGLTFPAVDPWLTTVDTELIYWTEEDLAFLFTSSQH